MIKVDLITGFLGSGKTTFLKLYAQYFINQGQRVGILENDYGAVNVDMLLLNSLRSNNCELEMVAGACDSDCHKRRFKTKLISMGMSGYNRVIIEPSGIFDVDEFFDSLREEPLDRWYEIGNVITIVDSNLESTLSDTASFYLASQIANAGMIVFSKTQLATPGQLQSTTEKLVEAAANAKLDKAIKPILFTKCWDELDENDFSKLTSCGYSLCSYVKKTYSMINDFSTMYFLELPLSTTEIAEITAALFENASTFGDVFRIKGFISENECWFQLNATKTEYDLSPISVGQSVIIVIGENLIKDAINQIFHRTE